MIRGTALQRKKPMRKSRPKMTPIRKSAKNEQCTLRIPGVCNNDPETVVWCHANEYQAGKGLGLKARDEEGCYGCYACHRYLDYAWAADKSMTRQKLQTIFAKAKHLSSIILARKGLV